MPEPVLGGGFGEQDAFGTVAGEAASVLAFFGFGHTNNLPKAVAI